MVEVVLGGGAVVAVSAGATTGGSSTVPHAASQSAPNARSKIGFFRRFTAQGYGVEMVAVDGPSDIDQSFGNASTSRQLLLKNGASGTECLGTC